MRILSHFHNDHDGGWTLMELLIVVAIIALLAVIFLLGNWKHYIERAQDAKRKTDVAAIRQAFEEYYNDNECYPASTILDNCGGDELSPYLKRIPCDPVSLDPYKFQPDDFSNMCLGNRICTKLRDLGDPDITAIGCHPVNGCGWGEGWNYCLATGTTVTAEGFDPGIPVPTSSPTPLPTPIYDGEFACSSAGTCQSVGWPPPAGCGRSWAVANCNNECPGNPQYWCP